MAYYGMRKQPFKYMTIVSGNIVLVQKLIEYSSYKEYVKFKDQRLLA